MNNYPACAEQKYVMEAYHVTFKSDMDTLLSQGWLVFPDSIQVLEKDNTKFFSAVLYKPLNKTYDREYDAK